MTSRRDIILIFADLGHRRSRRHCGSRAIMAPGGGDKPARDCGRLVRSQSLDVISFYRAKRGAERPQVSDRSARRVGKSLAVELPQVEFVGAHRAPEDGTKASERA